MSTTINTYVYLDKIPLDAIFDLVTAGIKEAQPQRDVRMLGSGIGGMYQFLFKGENDAQRILTLHARCHGDLPGKEELSEDGIEIEGAMVKDNTGLVMTIGATGCGLDVSKSVARAVSSLGPVVMRNEAEMGEPLFVPHAGERPSVREVLEEFDVSLYEASNIVSSLHLGGWDDETGLRDVIEDLSRDKEASAVVKRGSFRDAFTQTEDAPSL